MEYWLTFVLFFSFSVSFFEDFGTSVQVGMIDGVIDEDALFMVENLTGSSSPFFFPSPNILYFPLHPCHLYSTEVILLGRSQEYRDPQL